MISSQDLLQRKNFKADDVNYHTQDREQQNYDYHTLGVEIEGRPSNAMQTQTLIMPYTENNLSSGNRNNSRRNIERTPQLQSDSINDEVDHRFSSDDEEEKKNNREDKEEQKEASFNQSPTRMEKQAARMMDDPYKNIDASKNNASDASGEKEKSKIDEIHDFIDECNDELKSIDQIARSNQNEVEESKSQQARINLKSQHSNNRDPSLIIQKRERMNKTSNISKIENSSSSNLVPHQNISFSEGRRLDQMSSIPVQESPH